MKAAGEISIEMEKVLNSMPNAEGKIKADKVLELNADHNVTAKLKELYETDKEKLKKYAVVLYEQARLIEGLSIDDVSEYTLALSEIL